MIAYQIIDRFEFDCIFSLQLVNSILIAILYSNLETYDYCVFDSDHCGSTFSCEAFIEIIIQQSSN